MARHRNALLWGSLLAALALGGVAFAGLGRLPTGLVLGVLSAAGVWWLGRFQIED